MDNNSYDYSKQEGYYGSKDDYYDAEGNCYNSICNGFLKNKELSNKDAKITISDEKRCKLEKDIKEYFNKRSDSGLGVKDFNILLDFFVEKVIPDIYNEGVVDAYIYVIEKIKSLLELRK